MIPPDTPAGTPVYVDCEYTQIWRGTLLFVDGDTVTVRETDGDRRDRHVENVYATELDAWLGHLRRLHTKGAGLAEQQRLALVRVEELMRGNRRPFSGPTRGGAMVAVHPFQEPGEDVS